ncbi:MAG: hypothetical protein WAN51_08085 [Alphaproteobacteria bacterium]
MALIKHTASSERWALSAAEICLSREVNAALSVVAEWEWRIAFHSRNAAHSGATRN